MRMGMPRPSPTHHSRVGQPAYCQPSMPKRSMRSCMFSESAPGSAIPVTSPLTSTKKTGTPACEKPSAMTLRVTVLPVPEAPVTMPWRLAWLSSR